MKKELFRRVVTDSMNSLLTLPDDLWNETRPMINITVKDGDEKIRIVVGMLDLDEDDIIEGHYDEDRSPHH